MAFSHYCLLLRTGLLTLATLAAQCAVAGAPGLADALRLTLPQAEARFLDRNLALLAQRYNVTAAQAQIAQARVWDNPYVSIEQNTYNPQTERYFDITRTGNTAVQVTQLFAIAGRRRLAGHVAEQAARAEQFTLQDLLRSLRYELRTSFYDLYFAEQSLGVYDSEIGIIRRTVALFQDQYEKGNKALSEVIRLRAFLFELESSRQNVWRETVRQQADLRVLLADEPTQAYQPLADAAALRKLGLGAAPPLAALADSAIAFRADVLARQALVGQQEQNVRLQRALAAPDLTLGYVYDRAGNYIQNYNALSAGLAVPIFNHNQYNQRTARAQLGVSQAGLAQTQVQARSEVAEAYALAAETDRLYQSSGIETGEFDKLMADLETSYARRSLPLLEFLDLYESYTNDQVLRNTLSASRQRAFEQLNFAVGRLVVAAP